MNILLVEGCPTGTASIRSLLQGLGHETVPASSAEQVFDLCARQMPDAVIGPACAGEFDGIALTATLLQRVTPHALPVILYAENFDAAMQARAIAAGADVLLPEPVSSAALGLRLAGIERRQLAQRGDSERLALLGRYLAAEEEDLHIARHLIEHQLSPEGTRRVDDPAVELWQRHCARLGGNMVSVGRSPAGVLHVLLADASGFGLSACVSLLPLIAPFHRMTAKGFALPAIARELNRKVGETLPPNRSVAVQLAVVDTREGVVGVWNGGMPGALIFDGLGSLTRGFLLQHTELGRLADAAFDDSIEQHALNAGEQLVLVSSGLLEATDPAGLRFGEAGLAATFLGVPRTQRRAELIAAIEAHLAEGTPEADMTAVLIDCAHRQTAQSAVPAIAPSSPMPPPATVQAAAGWKFEMRLGVAELQRLDAVPLLLDVVGRFEGMAEFCGQLFVVLAELYNNALDHGLLRLDSRLKQAPEGLEAWLSRRAERLAELQAGEICLGVALRYDNGCRWLHIRCSDSGPGFDVPALLAASAAQTHSSFVHEQAHGRGLLLIRHMAHRLDFNAAGNVATVVLALDGGCVQPA